MPGLKAWHANGCGCVGMHSCIYKVNIMYETCYGIQPCQQGARHSIANKPMNRETGWGGGGWGLFIDVKVGVV